MKTTPELTKIDVSPINESSKYKAVLSFADTHSEELFLKLFDEGIEYVFIQEPEQGLIIDFDSKESVTIVSKDNSDDYYLLRFRAGHELFIKRIDGTETLLHDTGAPRIRRFRD